MTNKLFPTQEIGSLPKAPWLLAYLRGKPIDRKQLDDLAKWSQTSGFESESDVRAILASLKTSEGEERLRELASVFAIRYLESAGLDIVYDGEQNRIEMYEHPVRHSNGFEFYGNVRSFDDRYYRKAACTTKVGFRDAYHLDEFKLVKAHAKRRIKVPITGPYTIAEWSFNEYYQNKRSKDFGDLQKLKFDAKRDFVIDVAKQILSPNLKALVDAGAEWIQIDEPALTTKPEEVPFFVEAFNECTEGLGCKLSLHICFSNYRLLYPHILGLRNCSQLALEFANRADERGGAYDQLKLLNEFGDTREIGLGVTDVHDDRIESPELIRDRIEYASKILGHPERVYVNPDCGLRTRSWDVAYQKLRNISKGAALARDAISR